MSLTIPYISKMRIYIRPQKGDIGQDPEHTDIWYSFISEDDDRNLMGAYSRKSSFRENINLDVLPMIKDPSPGPNSDNYRFERNRVTWDHRTQTQSYPFSTQIQHRSHANEGQNFLKGINEFCAEEIKNTIYIYFRKNPDGTLEMHNKDMVERQKKVFGYLLKQFGTAIFSGRPITTISLPVIIFDTQSALEREARSLILTPHFLEKAGSLRDTLEQFKLAIAHYVSSLHVNIVPKKPFNPILGETFQCIVGGVPIYVEQISHHPPISALQMIGKNFTIDSVTEVTVSITMSSFRLCKVGHQKVHFKNTGTTIEGQFPPWCSFGGPLSRKTFQYADKLYVYDLKNKLYAEIVFDYEEPSLFKKAKVPQDHFSGGIWRINDKFIQELKKHPKKHNELNEYKFNEKEHSISKLGTIEGLWLEYLKIDGQTYWTIGNPQPYRLQYFDHPLPSDCNFRQDVLSFRAGDEEKAQIEKEKLEDIQRYDRKLRNKVKGKDH